MTSGYWFLLFSRCQPSSFSWLIQTRCLQPVVLTSKRQPSEIRRLGVHVQLRPRATTYYNALDPSTSSQSHLWQPSILGRNVEFRHVWTSKCSTSCRTSWTCLSIFIFAVDILLFLFLNSIIENYNLYFGVHKYLYYILLCINKVSEMHLTGTYWGVHWYPSYCFSAVLWCLTVHLELPGQSSQHLQWDPLQGYQNWREMWLRQLAGKVLNMYIKSQWLVNHSLHNYINDT